ncbi:MAG TPA: alpha/beta hydrolase [Microlunatus sp.]
MTEPPRPPAVWDGLAVHATGAGPTVLWLHGYTMRAEVWAPLWDLLPGWRHLGLDLPWHGDSRDLRPGEDLNDLADTVLGLMAAQQVEHVVALSFGTVLAAELASGHPTAAGTWLLAAPALAAMPHEWTVTERYRELAIAYARDGPGPHLTRLWMTSPPAIFAGVNARPAVRTRLTAIIDQHRWSELAGDGVRPLVARPQRTIDLAGARGRLHVVVGEDELLTHRACARSLQRDAGAVLHGMIGCGHLSLLEEPERAAELVQRVLAGTEPAAPEITR